MSTLTPKQVGDEMSMYTFRPGAPVLKRDLTRGTMRYYCFDKGHLRYTSSVPEGFVPVPEQVILKFFGTKYTLNIRKMERAFEDYAAGIQSGARRPTMRSLYLETPTDFELFIRPLGSFYCTSLKRYFSSILNIIETPSRRGVVRKWKPRVNALLNNTNTARASRWADATTGGQHKFIYVRLQNFGKMDPVPVEADPPTYAVPYPPPGQLLSVPAAPAPAPSPEDLKEASDVDMLERTNMGRSRKYRKVLLHMSPWKNCIRTTNPFESKGYRTAFMVAQHSFDMRYAEFKKDIEARRVAYRTAWAACKAFKDDQRSIKPSLPYVEEPDPVEFEREWKEFIFGLKQEMKNIELMPARGNKGATEQKIRSERRVLGMPTVPALKTVELVKPATPAQSVETKVIEHLKPLGRQPLVLPQVIMEKPTAHVVSEHVHTLDPDLLLIQQDLRYAKRVLVN